ncbi:MAG: MBL fold metallo-hydrolase [Erysipelotrichaceae bacterium]|nr:MBL fold metallo-hydrolase [Erysipelotrichaceae bacterium]
MSGLKWKRNMKAIEVPEYSSEYLMDEEGDIRLRSEPYFKAKKVTDGVWQVLSNGDYTYVLEGDDELLCIDGGNGVGDLRAFCQSLCPEKPLYRIVNTHFHSDHTMNNYLFDVTYMSKQTYSHRLAPEHEALGFPGDYPVVFLEDGDIFNLKGRELEVMLIDEHCPGSLQFLDRKSRILFCGDELNGNFFDSRISVERSYRNLKRWASYRKDYDILAAGNGLHDASYVDKYLEMAEYILFKNPDAGTLLYKPYEDKRAPIDEYNGKPCHLRRSPNLDSFTQVLKDMGWQDALDLNEGRACFCLLRKVVPDGIFDRQYEKDGVRFTYYRNRIWDGPKDKKYDAMIFEVTDDQKE